VLHSCVNICLSYTLLLYGERVHVRCFTYLLAYLVRRRHVVVVRRRDDVVTTTYDNVVTMSYDDVMTTTYDDVVRI